MNEKHLKKAKNYIVDLFANKSTAFWRASFLLTLYSNEMHYYTGFAYI